MREMTLPAKVKVFNNVPLIVRTMHREVLVAAVFVLTLSLPGSLTAGTLPDTGQTTCYNNSQEMTCPSPGQPFYGQDANYAPANPHSYTKLDENGNDSPDEATEWVMVRDNVTGLIWEVKEDRDGVSNYANPHDADNTYYWSDSLGDGTGTEDFINALNQEEFGGHSDWRLPAIKELSTLVESSIPSPGPTINTAYFPTTVSSYYWSSTTLADYPYSACKRGTLLKTFT